MTYEPFTPPRVVLHWCPDCPKPRGLASRYGLFQHIRDVHGPGRAAEVVPEFAFQVTGAPDEKVWVRQCPACGRFVGLLEKSGRLVPHIAGYGVECAAGGKRPADVAGP